MHENKNQQGQQPGQNDQRPLDKNQTLQDAGAAVPDYGRSEQTAIEQDNNPQQGMPLDNDETIGNP